MWVGFVQTKNNDTSLSDNGVVSGATGLDEIFGKEISERHLNDVNYFGSLKKDLAPLKKGEYLTLEIGDKIVSARCLDVQEGDEIQGQRYHLRLKDITGKVKTEQELAKVQGKCARIVEEAPYGIFEIDKKGNILFSNPFWAKMLGYENESELKSMVKNAKDIYANPETPRRSSASI